MDSPKPHLILIHDGPVPLDLLDAFENAVAVEGLDLRRETRPATRSSASMMLLMSTGVGLFLTKAYFDGLQDLGADHASVLDEALKQLGRRLTAMQARRMTAAGPGTPANRYSSMLSVWIERDADSRFKMLVRTDLSPDGLDAALGAYLAFAQAYLTSGLEAEDLEILAAARPLAGVVLMAYDEASGTIQAVDPFEGR
jgi:hypothetical protein